MSRRLVMSGVAVCAAAVLTVSGCGAKSTNEGGANSSTGGSGGGLSIVPIAQIDTSGNEVKPDESRKPLLPSQLGTAPCPETALAMVGALQGDNAALGINIINGVKLAVDQHNKANPACKITLKPFDTEGDPQKATQVIPQVINDPSIIGVIGPAFSGETKATGGDPRAGRARLDHCVGHQPDLSQNGWQTFFRGLANDDVQGPAVAKYMAGKLGYKKVCVIKDNSTYGVGLAKTITDGLGSAHDASCDADVKAKERDFSATVSKVTQAKPDAIFYSGYYAEAAPLVQQLKNQGVNAAFVSADGSNDPQFVSQAGSASKDAYLSCPCGPAKDPFKADYKAAFNQEPGVYSVEAYDLATILLKGIDEGKVTRPELLDLRPKTYNGTGLARQYKWTPQR